MLALGGEVENTSTPQECISERMGPGPAVIPFSGNSPGRRKGLRQLFNSGEDD